MQLKSQLKKMYGFKKTLKMKADDKLRILRIYHKKFTKEQQIETKESTISKRTENLGQ